MIDERALRLCLRAANFRVPQIKQSLAKAATGPVAGAKLRLDDAIRHTRELLDTLQTQKVALGWSDEERTDA